MAVYKVGKVIKVTVTGIMKYGAFVKVDDTYTGLIHISEMSNKFVKKITDLVTEGDIIFARIIDIDENNCHFKLSIKNLKYKVYRNTRVKKIVETPSGFDTLSANLPIWIEKSIKKLENVSYAIDKR